jgi:1-acyl-sn-glycerol-3-phosphate acyltransferase
MYFRYELVGLEHLPRDRSCLIALYHGTGIPMDLWCLAPRLADELDEFPLVFVLRTLERAPFFGHALRDLGCLFGEPDDDAMRDLVARKRHVIVCPGGMREGTRPFWKRYTVDWNEHTGYLRLAARFGLPVIPAAAHGVDDVYVGLNHGERASRRVLGHGAMPLYVALGLGGLWPVALPFPARIRQFLGQPIDVRHALDSEAALADVHARVVREVQSLLDQPRAR